MLEKLCLISLLLCPIESMPCELDLLMQLSLFLVVSEEEQNQLWLLVCHVSFAGEHKYIPIICS